MLNKLREFIKKTIKKTGWELVKSSVLSDIIHGIPTDYDKAHLETYHKVKEYTMTNSERIVTICNAIDYLSKNEIDGDIVECGVWRGGSIMAAIDTLNKYKSTEREIYLYDTFEGMPAPSEHDRKVAGINGAGMTAEDMYKNSQPNDPIWCNSPLNEVKQNIDQLNYPTNKIHYIKGKVEDTIPLRISKKIALLRLDTNFYESTKHELKYLYPLLVPGGVIIINDYGDWEGARKAIDEYIAHEKISLLLNRIDYTGRVGVKSS